MADKDGKFLLKINEFDQICDRFNAGLNKEDLSRIKSMFSETKLNATMKAPEH